MSLFRPQLAALALAFVAGAASAAPLSVSSNAVTLASQNDSSGEAVVLEKAGQTWFSLPALAAALNAQTVDGSASKNYAQSFTVSARAGYRITGFELFGSVDGLLAPGSLAGETTAGTANNGGEVMLTTAELGSQAAHPQQGTAFFDLNGADSFYFDETGLSLLDGLLLTLTGSSQVSATPAIAHGGSDSGDKFAPSIAQFKLSDVGLTVYTEALAADVPEPAGLALFGLGFGMVGLMRRRSAKARA